MSDQQHILTAGLMLGGLGAFAIGNRRGDTDDEDDDPVEVEIHG